MECQARDGALVSLPVRSILSVLKRVTRDEPDYWPTLVTRFLLFVVKEDSVERSEFVNIGEAARRLGTSEPAIRRRIQRGDLKAYAHPLDMRMKLLKIADLDRYGADVRALRVGEKEVAIA
jgi:hypothetical protein